MLPADATGHTPRVPLAAILAASRRQGPPARVALPQPVAQTRLTLAAMGRAGAPPSRPCTPARVAARPAGPTVVVNFRPTPTVVATCVGTGRPPVAAVTQRTPPPQPPRLTSEALRSEAAQGAAAGPRIDRTAIASRAAQGMVTTQEQIESADVQHEVRQLVVLLPLRAIAALCGRTPEATLATAPEDVMRHVLRRAVITLMNGHHADERSSRY